MKNLRFVLIACLLVTMLTFTGCGNQKDINNDAIPDDQQNNTLQQDVNDVGDDVKDDVKDDVEDAVDDVKDAMDGDDKDNKDNKNDAKDKNNKTDNANKENKDSTMGQ